jgi:hypothetical protein
MHAARVAVQSKCTQEDCTQQCTQGCARMCAHQPSQGQDCAKDVHVKDIGSAVSARVNMPEQHAKDKEVFGAVGAQHIMGAVAVATRH